MVREIDLELLAQDTIEYMRASPGRKCKGVNKRKLAQEAGLNRDHLTEIIEQRTSRITHLTLAKLCRVYDCEPMKYFKPQESYSDGQVNMDLFVSDLIKLFADPNYEDINDQVSLAKRLGTQSPQISRVFTGVTKRIHRGTLERYCTELGFDSKKYVVGSSYAVPGREAMETIRVAV